MRAVKVVSGYRNLERLTEVMKPFSVRLTKDDCLDLPDKLWQRHYVDMTKEQKRAYEELRDTALTILGSGEEVSSTIPLTTILKLQQICSGFVKDDEGTVVKIPCEKLDALMQIAKNAQPLVIFCAFRENVRILRDALTDAFGPDSCSLYMGGMNNDQRTEAVQRFKSGISKFFLATSAGAKGLTLTEASTLVYYSCDYKLETRLQSQDRIHRIGQSKKCTYIDLVCPGSIEEKILLALDGKKQLSDMVLEELVELIRNS
jgi:SNF2 family DNA or RNA helicase